MDSSGNRRSNFLKRSISKERHVRAIHRQPIYQGIRSAFSAKHDYKHFLRLIHNYQRDDFALLDERSLESGLALNAGHEERIFNIRFGSRLK